MRKTLIFLSSLAGLLVPTMLGAQGGVSGKIDPEIWHINTVVTVKGERLRGLMPSKSKLCFAPIANENDLRCFLSNHGNIKYWTDLGIQFTPPKNAPPVGHLVLIHPRNVSDCFVQFGRKSCNTKTIKDKTILGEYKAHPYISSVTRQGSTENVTSFEAGKKYEIKGYRLGDSGYGIFIGSDMINRTDIDIWSHDAILFTPSEDYVQDIRKRGEYALRVHNGAAKSNPWALHNPKENKVIETVQTRTRGKLIRANLTNTEGEEFVVNTLPFSDVSSGHPYAKAIAWGYESGFLQGYEDGTFRPDQDVTRAEFLKIMLSGDPRIAKYADATTVPFRDVKLGAWYLPYVLLSTDVDATEGYADGSFRPHNSVNVAEALKMAYRFFKVPTTDPKGLEWYSRYYEHASQKSILFSSDIAPAENMTRKDVVWMVWQLLKLTNPELVSRS